MLKIGKDARTDVIGWACKRSPTNPELFAFAEMPIPGFVEKCGPERVFTGKLTDRDELLRVIDAVRPDLVIIGPEEPLEAGFVDVLQSREILAFGPSKALARIESSKAWARQLLDKYQIPGNPRYRVFRSLDGVQDYMEELGAFVVKPDGLTAGKGVRVFGEHLSTIAEALAYVREVLSHDGQIQVEERLDGEEFSLQTITDGKTVIHCPLVQDHKRAYRGDTGPNTGGMGSYSCPDFSLPFLEAGDVAMARSINERVIDALARETGQPYRGVLYGGFMATRDGVSLIEYNCRFGDPEAMNVIPLLDADFVEICAAVATGNLDKVSWSFESKATVCKYMVPAAYPEPTTTAAKVTIPDRFRDTPDLKWYWAACRLQDDEVYLTSSRSGAFVGMGRTLFEAEQVAEAAAREVEASSPVRHRNDIGRAEAINARVQHMRSLREGALHAVGAPR